MLGSRAWRRKLAKTGRKVAGASRSGHEAGGGIRAYTSDATNPSQVKQLFDDVERELGPLDAVVYNASGFRMGSILELDPAAFESMWRVGCFAGMLVGQEAARRMVPRGRGAVVFTGATASRTHEVDLRPSGEKF